MSGCDNIVWYLVGLLVFNVVVFGLQCEFIFVNENKDNIILDINVNEYRTFNELKWKLFRHETFGFGRKRTNFVFHTTQDGPLYGNEIIGNLYQENGYKIISVINKSIQFDVIINVNGLHGPVLSNSKFSAADTIYHLKHRIKRIQFELGFIRMDSQRIFCGEMELKDKNLLVFYEKCDLTLIIGYPRHVRLYYNFIDLMIQMRMGWIINFDFEAGINELDDIKNALLKRYQLDYNLYDVNAESVLLFKYNERQHRLTYIDGERVTFKYDFDDSINDCPIISIMVIGIADGLDPLTLVDIWNNDNVMGITDAHAVHALIIKQIELLYIPSIDNVLFVRNPTIPSLSQIIHENTLRLAGMKLDNNWIDLDNDQDIWNNIWSYQIEGNIYSQNIRIQIDMLHTKQMFSIMELDHEFFPGIASSPPILDTEFRHTFLSRYFDDAYNAENMGAFISLDFFLSEFILFKLKGFSSIKLTSNVILDNQSTLGFQLLRTVKIPPSQSNVPDNIGYLKIHLMDAETRTNAILSIDCNINEDAVFTWNYNGDGSLMVTSYDNENKKTVITDLKVAELPAIKYNIQIEIHPPQIYFYKLALNRENIHVNQFSWKPNDNAMSHLKDFYYRDNWRFGYAMTP